MVRRVTFLRNAWRRAVAHPLLMAWVVSLVVSLGLWSAFLHDTPLSGSASYLTSRTSDAPTLSDADAALYRQAYDAQDRGDFEAANLSLSQVTDKRLTGHLLADRYTSSRYSPTTAELGQWLAQYSDHPQAAAISKLALRRGMDVAVIAPARPLKGEGYAEHLGRTTMPDSWYHALTLWREQQFAEAFPLFVAIGDNAALSDWQRSAGYYWASRAATKTGDSDAAETHLLAAANYQTTFYGILAAAQSATLTLEAQAPTVSPRLRQNPAAIRAALLAQIGRTEDAEEQLRHLYSSASATDRAGLVTLAHELNLPNLQVRLAGMGQLTDAQSLYASYPIPEFMVTAQKQVSPALLLAIARNESGFRESSASHAGAIGLIQMLPATARALERRVGIDRLQSASIDDSAATLSDRLNDPATSARYGAAYVTLLTQQPAVGRNLVRVLAAYNAGPGTVAAWQSAASKIDDPLLYIESIPYPETHNYVMQVMAQYWIYQRLLGEDTTSLDAMAHGQWPQLTLGS